MNKQLIRNPFVLYLLLFTFWGIFRYAYFPSVYDASMQIFMLFLGIILLALKKSNSKSVFFSVFLFQLLCSCLMIGLNNHIYGDVYGYNSIDGATYRSYGNIFQTFDFYESISFLKNNGKVIDDFGYSLIIFFSTKISGDCFLQLVFFLNTLVVAIGSVYLYKLSLYFLSKDYSAFVALIWGIMPYAIYTTSAGLKENFFVFFIILSIYYLYRYILQKHFYLLCLFLLFTFITVLFRIVIGYGILLSFLLYILLNNRTIFKYYKITLVFLLIISLFSFSYFASLIMNQRGYEYDVIEASTNEKSGGVIGIILNYVAGFIGPIPNFVSTNSEKLTYITRYSFSPFFKMMISFYFWYAVYYIVRNKYIIFFPMLLFFAINTIMLLFTFFSLHDRYQWPHIPFFMLISVYGYVKCQNLKSIKRLYSWYLFAVLMIILVFNFR